MNNYSDSRFYKFWKIKNEKYYRRHRASELVCKHFKIEE